MVMNMRKKKEKVDKWDVSCVTIIFTFNKYM